jgi:hypothetical protein
MNFLEAQNEIVALVKRPDKRDAIKGHINRAIAFVAAAGTWSHDLVELQHTIASDDYSQSFAINESPFERFRKIKYIRPTGFRKYLTLRDSAAVFDANGCQAINVYYRAGNNIVFNLSSLQETLEIGYYQYHAPLVLDADVDWMLDEIWPVIHDIAISYTFQDIGNDADSNKYLQWGMTQLRIFLRDLGDGVSNG